MNNNIFKAKATFKFPEVKVDAELEEKTINPAITTQEVSPDEGYDGFSKVTVNKVDNTIDNNIKATNIKKGVTILGVTGSVEEDLPAQTKTVTPTTSSQNVTADSGYKLGSVTVNGVTNAIDSNIKAENIKLGVSILGVQGNLEEDKPDQTKEVTPTTSNQDVVADTGFELARVTVKGVTSAIDNNIQASNIKKDTTILGVTGTVEELKGQEKVVNPTTSDQTIEPDTNYTGLTKVVVKAVENDIDENINAENIKEGVTILGIEGNVIELVGQEKEVTPTDEEQYIEPDEGYNGLTSVTVNPIPSEYIVPSGSIDITQSGTYSVDVTNYATANVDVQGGGVSSVEMKDINFFDYDGTLLESWTLEQLATKTSLPEQPEHDGLTADGWNWSLADLKVNNRPMNVGAHYKTTDDKLHIYIDLNDAKRLSIYLPIYFTLSGGTYSVDWGDGNTDSYTYSSYTSLQHNYSNTGNFVIKISRPTAGAGYTIFGRSNSGTFYSALMGDFRNTNDVVYYRNCVKKIEANSGIKINQYGLADLQGLETISLPSDCFGTLNATFLNMCSLKFLTISKALGENTATTGLASINSAEHISFPENYKLNTSVILTNSYNLKEVLFGNNSSSSTSINNASISNCFSVKKMALPNNITKIYRAFTTMYNLEELYLPTSLTTVDVNYFLADCINLKYINLEETQLTETKEAFMRGCSSITGMLKMPSTIATIGSNSFNGCYSLRAIDFTGLTSVPTLSNVNAFSNVSDIFKIVVPDSLYDSWIQATNWSSTGIVEKIIKESEYNA